MSETITDFIKQDLRARLGRDAGLPTRLTLHALAAHYQVSTTPVRLALRDLIDERILSKEDNGQLRVNPGTRAAPSRDDEIELPVRAFQATEVEQALVQEILRTSLSGREEYLREEVTAERFGIGRTLLRQVLGRLAGKGLIQHLPNRGWLVHRYDETEMTAYLQVRESLELKALELARANLVPADLKRMLAGNRPADGSPAERLDNDLHRYLVEKSGNRFIRDFFERNGVFYEALFAFAAPEANAVRAMAKQHRGILRALLTQDWPKARKALAQHIRSQRPIVKRLLGRTRSEPMC